MSDIINALGSALYSTLAAGTALTTKLGGTAIYNTLVPQGTDEPYVVYFLSAGGDDNSSPRRARSMVYTVKAVTADSDANSGLLQGAEIDSLLDDLLHEQTLTITGWGNYWTARTSDISYSQEAGGVLYWHSGGQYRIRIAE